MTTSYTLSHVPLPPLPHRDPLPAAPPPPAARCSPAAAARQRHRHPPRPPTSLPRHAIRVKSRRAVRPSGTECLQGRRPAGHTDSACRVSERSFYAYERNSLHAASWRARQSSPCAGHTICSSTRARTRALVWPGSPLRRARGDSAHNRPGRGARGFQRLCKQTLPLRRPCAPPLFLNQGECPCLLLVDCPPPDRVWDSYPRSTVRLESINSSRPTSLVAPLPGAPRRVRHMRRAPPGPNASRDTCIEKGTQVRGAPGAQGRRAGQSAPKQQALFIRGAKRAGGGARLAGARQGRVLRGGARARARISTRGRPPPLPRTVAEERRQHCLFSRSRGRRSARQAPCGR